MRHLELFSGIGGFRQAIELVGMDCHIPMECVGYSEIDAKAKITYQSNFNIEGEIDLGDIVEFTSNVDDLGKLPDFELLTGGFPCQTFSVMGEQAGFNEDRGQMFFRIMDIIRVKHPKYVLLENVKNLCRHDGGKTYARIEQELENEGYRVFSNIFNSIDFGLPQRRSRVLIFATTENVSFNFGNFYSSACISGFFYEHLDELSVLHYDNMLDILQIEVPLKYFLSERIKPTILSNGTAKFCARSDINQLIARTLTASMHKMHRACQDNYYSQDFIESRGEINHVGDYTKEQLAQLDIRRLTPKEAFLLQGFPGAFADNAREAGVSDGALYKQAGNAVSVNVVYAILYYLICNNVIYV